ncbi:MAG: VacJ family lipoprotein [SAR324 cluster bacterium]|nr:VacJ family lipoprotein [SAR324 cluster bacterium]
MKKLVTSLLTLSLLLFATPLIFAWSTNDQGTLNSPDSIKVDIKSPSIDDQTPVASPYLLAQAGGVVVGGYGDDDFDEDLEGEFAETDSTKSDPFSGYNSFMTDFNDGVYTYALDPVARGYRWVLPESPRRGVVNFFKNIWYPIRFVNNLLQGKLGNATEETGRFLLNSTIGIFGFWDPAKEWFDLEEHPEDFGQTLGLWGVGAGPHIVLPFLGPSNLRDSFALAPDYFIDPITYVRPVALSWGLVIYESVNDTSLHIGEYENLKADALELYPFLRDAYEQNRIKKIQE